MRRKRDATPIIAWFHSARVFIRGVRALITGINERNGAEQELPISHEKYQNIFNLVPDMVGITRMTDGTLLEVNGGFEEWTGWTKNEVIGHTTLELGLWDRETRLRAMDTLTEKGQLKDFEFVFTTKAGEQRNALMYLTRTIHAGEQCLYFMAHDITPLKRANAILEKEQSQLKALLQTIPALIWMKDPSGVYLTCNHYFERLFGTTEAEILGKTDYDFVSAAQADSFRENDKKAMASNGAVTNEEWVTYTDDGHQELLETIKTPVYNVSGELIGVLGIARNISERVRAEEQLRIAATAFESQEGMVITDAKGLILRVNQSFTEICGYTEAEVLGKNPRFLKSRRHTQDFYREMWESIALTGRWQGEIWDRRKNGEEYPKWLTVSAVKNAHGIVTNYIGAHYDITARKKAEEKIHELAFFDQLTGLPNRTLLLDRLRQSMTASSRSGECGALLFLDLDNFKALNDTLGHDVGDLLLKQVGQRIVATVRAIDTTARLGGDEFVIVLTNLNADIQVAATQTETVGIKVLAALNKPYYLKETTYHCTPSIGATIFTGMQSDIEALLKQADIAMYRAKDAGRNRLRFFDPEMEVIVVERATLEKDLRTAILEKQFTLYYQGQVTADSLTGVEALIRWQHPVRGLVSPREFIPLAEETGLIISLGQWVLEAACQQLALWGSKPEMSLLTMAVNVSAHQFHHPDFVSQVLETLRITGTPPHQLKIELTESLLVSNVEDTIEKMVVLKSWGIGFSLDDFGTGYSSLSYLKRLPLDQLKIDQSFVRDILTDPNDAAIARTVIALADNLGLGVIAEGVESAEQRDFLTEAGCHAFQGYFFSRPLPIIEFEDFFMKFQTSPQAG